MSYREQLFDAICPPERFSATEQTVAHHRRMREFFTENERIVFRYLMPLRECSPDVCQRFENFIYDSKSGLFLVDADSGFHNFIMASLYFLHHAESEPQSFHCSMNITEHADAYIQTGIGLFKSSVSNRITLSNQFKFTIAERRILGAFERDYV